MLAAVSRQDSNPVQKFCRETVEIDFPFTRKVNYRALGACLLFTTNNKEPTFDLDSSLAQRWGFLLSQFQCGEGSGPSQLLPVTCLRMVVSPAPILPTIPDKPTWGMQPAQGMKPAEGTAQCGLAMSTACPRMSHLGTKDHSWCQTQPWLLPEHVGLAWQHCSIPKGSQSPLAWTLQPSGTRFCASWAGGTWIIPWTGSAKHCPSLPYFVLTWLLSVAVSWGEDWICLALVFLTAMFKSCWMQHFPLWLCWHHGQNPEGRWTCTAWEWIPHALGRGGWLLLPHSCRAVGSWCFYPWKGQMPPNRSFRKWAAPCRAQPSHSSVPTSLHCTALLLPALPGPAWNPSPTKSIHSSREGSNQKRKMGGKPNLALWHLWHTDKNTKWQEVLFLKAIILLLSEHTCVSSNPQQLLHGTKLPPQYALRTKSWATT